MDNSPGIQIDAQKIKTVNSDAMFYQGYLCVPAPDRQQPSTREIDAAIAEIRMDELPDQRYHAVQVSRGSAIYIWQIDSPRHAVEVAGVIAGAIAAVGFSGTITACADKLGPRPRTGRMGYTAAICAADAALDHRETPLAFRETKKNLDRWAVNSRTFRDIVDLFVRWAMANATGPVLAGLHFTLARCEAHQVADVIMQCCADVGCAELLFPTRDGDRYVIFSWEGWILPSIEIKGSETAAWESLTGLLTDMAPHVDYAAVTSGWFGIPTPRSAMIQHGIPGPEAIDLSADHHSMKTTVPGIFGAQVLGTGHPDLQPPGFWNVTPLGAGRRMFTAPNASDWWTTPTLHPENGFDELRQANRQILGDWM
ncbi:hypothetical protein [Pseudarthrobacter sp. NPDC058119]|uniref:hypothetical protein n=1 Tax=Pseudarthrobacter sp. NPDC058119 TaxID=3346348 RepID=UPI0036DED05D